MSAFGDRFIALVLALALSLGVLAFPMTGARWALRGRAACLHRRQLRRHHRRHQRGRCERQCARRDDHRCLQEGRLFFSAEGKRVFIQDKSDRLIDAATGEPVAGNAPADLAPVRLNNRLRGSSRPRSAA